MSAESGPTNSSCSIVLAAFMAATFMIIPVNAMIHLSFIWPGIIYLVMSFKAYWIYEHDKIQAECGGCRDIELFLHLYGFFFGWPGALLAQWILRHKIHKSEFQLIFWTYGLVHQIFWYFHTPPEFRII